MSKKIKLLFFLSLIFFICLIYDHTNTLVVSHHSFSFAQGNKSIKLAQISDLHSDSIGKLENELFKILAQEKPDIIAITGDFATPNGKVKGYKQILEKLKAPMGVYFVPGNWEYWQPIEDLEQSLKDSNIINLSNRIKKLAADFYLIGFDDSVEGRPNIELLLNLPKEATKIALFHSPQFFDSITGKIQLALAGHSHGGQIRLPIWGELATPEGTGKYVQGLYSIQNSHLYVSRGIGTSVIPVRMFCSPELAIFDIKY